MSGSKSNKFVGRSFNDNVNGLAYGSTTGLGKPTPGNGFVAAARVRFNGAMTPNVAGSEGAVLWWFDTASNGFVLGVTAPLVGVPATSALTGVQVTIGDGVTDLDGVTVAPPGGVLGREAIISLWYLAEAQAAHAGANGYLSTRSAALAGPLTLPPADLPKIGTASFAPVVCSSGLASVAEVGIYEFGPNDPTEAELAMASIRMVAASKKAGALRLYDPDVVDYGGGEQGIFAGQSWDHYWRPGTSRAAAPTVLPDEGTENVPMVLECAQDEQALIIQPGTMWAESEFTDLQV